MKTITEHEIIDHGVENSQYFQGCGVAYTRFEEVWTGIGSSPREALDDALDSVAQADWDTAAIVNDLSEKISVPEESEDCYHYVSIRVTSLAYAAFNRFEIEMPGAAVEACAHSGSCDHDVAVWAPKIKRPKSCNEEILRAELKEYGAWDAEELANDAANWRRIVWIAAGNIAEERKAKTP